ncbi:hypothetical protein ACQJBY_059078 [Aegilops geniculata]
MAPRHRGQRHLPPDTSDARGRRRLPPFGTNVDDACASRSTAPVCRGRRHLPPQQQIQRRTPILVHCDARQRRAQEEAVLSEGPPRHRAPPLRDPSRWRAWEGS